MAVQIAPAADHRATALTPRGAAVLAILRAQDLVRDLDQDDRDYGATYVADMLLDVATDVATP